MGQWPEAVWHPPYELVSKERPPSEDSRLDRKGPRPGAIGAGAFPFHQTASAEVGDFGATKVSSRRQSLPR